MLVVSPRGGNRDKTFLWSFCQTPADIPSNYFREKMILWSAEVFTHEEGVVERQGSYILFSAGSGMQVIFFSKFTTF